MKTWELKMRIEQRILSLQAELTNLTEADSIEKIVVSSKLDMLREIMNLMESENSE